MRANKIESSEIDLDFNSIPGWNATQQIWDDIAEGEFEVSSNYSPIPNCVATILDKDYFE